MTGARSRPARGLLAAIYGPTSSGKTSVSVEMARRLEHDLDRQVIIISADSRQVYRHMDRGTSKTTPAQMRGIRHEMLDVADPVRKFELEEYARLARGHISDAFEAGHIPLIVGGTGVYVMALLKSWQVDRTGAARDSLRRDFPPSMVRDAYGMLRRLSRTEAAKVHPNNYEAVTNVLAALVAGDDKASPASSAAPRTLILGLDPGPHALADRVARTYDDQVRHGLLAEIQALNARYGLTAEYRRRGQESQNQVLHTHGYREYFDVAVEHGKDVTTLTEGDLTEVRGRVLDHIRRYTFRQRGWFRKLPEVRMITSADQGYPLVARALAHGRGNRPG